MCANTYTVMHTYARTDHMSHTYVHKYKQTCITHTHARTHTHTHSHTHIHTCTHAHTDIVHGKFLNDEIMCEKFRQIYWKHFAVFAHVQYIEVQTNTHTHTHKTFAWA